MSSYILINKGQLCELNWNKNESGLFIVIKRDVFFIRNLLNAPFDVVLFVSKEDGQEAKRLREKKKKRNGSGNGSGNVSGNGKKCSLAHNVDWLRDHRICADQAEGAGDIRSPGWIKSIKLQHGATEEDG